MRAIVGLLLIFCYTTDFVSGNCLSYGHSCWGGHGKRSNIPKPIRQIVAPPSQWALVKIVPDKDRTRSSSSFFRGTPNNGQPLVDDRRTVAVDEYSPEMSPLQTFDAHRAAGVEQQLAARPARYWSALDGDSSAPSSDQDEQKDKERKDDNYFQMMNWPDKMLL